jgi:hypothetical protein
MRNDRFRKSRKDTFEDIGTLWSMHRGDHRARCALLASGSDWELRVLVDGMTVHGESCEGSAAAFALAEKWKQQMIAQGWHQILPSFRTRPSQDERHPR